ncbi:MAG: PHP domain-containing protein [Gemmatimonadota bacterium]|nr:PHP domain-containing protein [Gemmatimonadota bacterium]
MTQPAPDEIDDPADVSLVDLHAHTTASDGTATPERFVQAACAAGLRAVAVTDHDTVAAVPAVRDLATGTGLRVVAGVELSVHDDAGKEVHLLGLHLADLAMVDAALASVRDARVERARAIVGKLNALGVPVGMDAVLAESGGGAVGRPHVARALVKAGHAPAMQAAFDRWLGAGRPAYVEKERLSVADGIALVRRAGGISVWAHPGPDGTRERIAALAALGLDGVEVRHPSHGVADIKRLRGHVSALGLVPSGGSDWHGASEGPRTLGCMRVSAAWMDRQLEYLTRREA